MKVPKLTPVELAKGVCLIVDLGFVHMMKLIYSQVG